MAVSKNVLQREERTGLAPEALRPGALLDLWDECAQAELPQRARAILRAAYRQLCVEDLDAMAIGQWNSALLRFRAAQFGTELRIFDRCPSCQGSVEFAVETSEILPAADPLPDERYFSSGDWSVRFRPLTGGDWLRSFQPGCGEPKEAGKRLLSRALLQVRHRSREATPEEMPDPAWEALAEALVEADTASEILFRLRCPSCREEWDSPLEPAEFVWREINAACRRLLRQIHALAWAYGWSEAEIVGLSQERRTNYLRMIEETGAVPNN
jgi:hypothetical protein